MGYLGFLFKTPMAWYPCFQFPLWDTQNSALTLRGLFYIFFQFPLWDTLYILGSLV